MSETTSSRDDPEAAIKIRDEEVGTLARQITAHSAKYNPDGDHNVVHPVKGSHLDPNSPNFDTTSWLKAFVDLFESHPDSLPKRMTGVAFKNLNVSGHSTGARYQDDTANVFLSAASSVVGHLTGRGIRRVDILQDFEGLIEPGETLLVLGPPGSGCSTLLKTLAGRIEGLDVSESSYMNFRGISSKRMHSWFRNDVLYNAEVDVHLAPLTVGDTLEFAALCRAPAKIPGGFQKREFVRAYRDAVMAVFGIGHTVNTKVGDDFIRGVSGGERKRVSIAEAALAGAKFQCWDNSTRGLDSGNAISFCKHLRMQADLMHVAAVVAIYQAPQAAYEVSHLEITTSSAQKAKTV